MSVVVPQRLYQSHTEQMLVTHNCLILPLRVYLVLNEEAHTNREIGLSNVNGKY